MSTISIVIPSYKHLDDCLRPCLESIKRHTDLTDVEVIVVLNGCGDDGSAEFVESLGAPFRYFWLDEPSGYTHSTNVGISVADGDYIILLNNDTVILGAHWINLLLQPFLDDPTVGITGPLMLHCPDADEDFLVFFCAMISRACLNAIGGELDEAFSPGYGEDCAAAIEARRAGFKVLQVPPTQPRLVDKGCEDLPQWKRDKMWHNEFPIYHDGNKSFGDDPEAFDVILNRNKQILQDRYGPRGILVNSTMREQTGTCECGEPLMDGVCVGAEGKLNCDGLYLWRAAQIDGWFGTDEGAQLATWVRGLPPNSNVLSIGAWHGRSSRFIADNLSTGSKLWDVDSFLGSSGEPEMHGSAHWDRGDHAFQWYWCNLHEHIMAGRVVPVRMWSENAAHTFKHLHSKDQLPKFDLIFIDGDHSEEGIKTDVESWLPLLREGGLICGHDYYKETEGPHWVHVRQYVEAKFPAVQKAATSLWYVRPEFKRRIIDAFPLCDELDLLEVRLHEIGDVVDRSVIAEGTLTNTGQPKPLHLQASFEREPERWARWRHKIEYIVVDDFPDLSGAGVIDAAWTRERWQRDALLRGMGDCRDDDVVLIGDADEIPSVTAITAYDPAQGLCRLQQRLFYCYMNLENRQGWDWQKIAPYSMVRALTPCGVRYPPAGHTPLIADGGSHFSWMGGPEAWVEKLERTAHQEYNTPEFKDRATMLERVLGGRDLLGRQELSYEFVEIDDTFPRFIRDNRQRFITNHFIYEAPMHDEANDYLAQVKAKFPDYFTGQRVLEVGSLDINGTPRRLFRDCDYTGLDLVAGYGVDVIGQAHEHVGEYDVVVSTEMLEHDEHWRESLSRMYQNLRPGGLMVVTCAGPKREEHGTRRTETYSSPATPDYYRNITIDDWESVLPMDGWADAELCYGRGGEDLYFHGIKAGTQTDFTHTEEEVSEAVATILKYRRPSLTVTAEISTKDRYETTLPMCIAAILSQTVKPAKLLIYDDGEQRDLRELPPFDGLLKLADDLGIEWQIFTTPRKGQVVNHQHCLDTATTDLILRCDDDLILAPDCLEHLLAEMKEGVGAVAPLIHHPGNVSPLPPMVNGSLHDIALGMNMQWFDVNGQGVREVEHLYSSFLLRVSALKEAGGYPRDLSTIGHREESIASHNMYRAGYKLIVAPMARAYHLRASSGGIRSFNDPSLWEHDEQIWQQYLRAWGVVQADTKLVVLDCGIGDHLLFKGILPELRRKHPERQWTLAVCYPEVFADVPDVSIISIADAKLIVGDRYEDHLLYAWTWRNNKQQHIVESMKEFWG